MIFFSIFCALLIDHFKAIRAHNPILTIERFLATRIEAWFNAGYEQHGRAGWWVMVSIMVLPVLVMYGICLYIHPLIGLIWNVLILYLCMGFRRYSQHFTSIQMALLVGDEAKARTLLATWSGEDTTGMEADEITRMSIEKALLDSHRSTFGIFFWFVLPLGPAGAVLYRTAAYLAETWKETSHDSFGHFANRAFYWVDWIPVRLTAMAFAIVGNFEDAVYAWRNFADRWQDTNIGTILATGGGAMGVRLGNPSQKAAYVNPVDITIIDSQGLEAEVQPGEEPNIRFFQSAIGLIWRALLLWMLLLFLFTIVIWLG